MMDERFDQPAFPRDHRHDGHNGISLRDYFAAKAMQGFAADSEVVWASTEEMARWAYEWADAMLKVRAAAAMKEEG